MQNPVRGLVAALGRVMIATIFLMSAVGNKIPKFNDVAGYMASEGVPLPQLMLVGAIVFLIAGSLSIIAGYKCRIGAALLLVFLILATYFFHDFWTFEGQEQQIQMIQFMKNLSMMGTMLFLMATGAGPMSLDARLTGRPGKLLVFEQAQRRPNAITGAPGKATDESEMPRTMPSLEVNNVS
jgi:putative oxidoreductase